MKRGAVLDCAWLALTGFLRGFLGVREEDDHAPAAGCHSGRHASAPPSHPDRPTPAAVRAALTARASGHGTCC